MTTAFKEKNQTLMEEKSGTSRVASTQDGFSFREFFTQCAAQWKWFVISAVFFSCVGVYYALSREPIYSRSMEILIKNQKRGSTGSDITSAFSSMGLVASNTNVNNELISLKSPAVMFEVVKRLDLDMNYSTPGRFYQRTLYGNTLPLTVKFLDLEAQQGGSFRIKLGDGGAFTLTDFRNNDENGIVKYPGEVKGNLKDTLFNTPLGKVVVLVNPSYQPGKGKKHKPIKEIKVWRSGLQSTVEKYSARLRGGLVDKDADVLELSMKDAVAQRASDILNEVVKVNNQNWADDKNILAISTSKFISERLSIIEKELGGVDTDISEFKSKHHVPDLVEAAKLNIKQSSELSNSMLDLTNKMTMAVYLRDYVKDPENATNVIPVNTGIGSQQLESQIANYNNLLLSRNTLASNSSDRNPIVMDYDEQLAGLRTSIEAALTGQVAAFNKSLKNLEGAKGLADSNLASGPTQANSLLGMERRQAVLHALYLFLLQKREENELTQTFSADNTRIITPPTGKLMPIAPKKKMIVMIAFLLGVAIPGVALYIVEATNTKVRSRKDLETMTTPFVGEIPYVGSRNRIKAVIRKFSGARRNKSRKLETVVSAVKAGSRDILSESFRIIRGNIDFMLQKDKGCNVIMLTSFNPGSGKSFITYNLSASFALKGKRVLVIDGDLRHGSTSQFVGMPSKGISNYLTGNTDEWKNLVVPVKDHEGMFVLPIGHRPPNPSELLDNERLATLLNQAREDYDYVFIDCPPVDVVVDTQIVEKYVDRTIFIVRAGLLDRRAVAEIDELYHNGRFKQMSIVLNATDSRHSRVHTYGGYGYYGN